MRTHAEVVQGIAGFVEANLGLLKSVTESWQPSDVLPDLTADGWPDQIRALRAQARGVPDDLLIVLVGNTVTEEALPNYQTMLNRHPGVTDDTGASDTPWARWSRGWTAEEYRHGTILTRYLYLSGRVDLRAVEITTQHLIRNGFNFIIVFYNETRATVDSWTRRPTAIPSKGYGRRNSCQARNPFPPFNIRCTSLRYRAPEPRGTFSRSSLFCF